MLALLIYLSVKMSGKHLPQFLTYIFSGWYIYLIFQRNIKDWKVHVHMKIANSLLNSFAFQAPPVLNPELRNQSVAFKSALNLTCIVRGDRPLQINWTRNGVDLGNRDNDTYAVSQMTFEHAGLYGCTAKNWAGKVYACFRIDVTGKVFSCDESEN